MDRPLSSLLWLLLLAALVGSAPALAGGEDPSTAPAAERPAGAEPAAPVPAVDAGCVDAAITAIQKRYETARDLAARFEQSTWSVTLGAGRGGAAPATSRGSVVFAKPGKMRWTYEEPEESLVVSDGETLWLYDPFHQEAQKMPVGDGWLSGAAVQFLLGEGDMRRDFRVTGLACDAGSVELELHPRSAASFEKLGIVADPASGDLRRTRITDVLGNVTEVAFTDIRVNREPKAETFRFEAPEGVDVIEVEPVTPAAGGRPR